MADYTKSYKDNADKDNANINNAGWKSKAILFLTSQSITLFGSTLVQMAIIWYVTLSTSSGAWVSAFTVCAYLPQFLISFVGGVLADRHNKKKLIILSDGGIAIATLALILAMPYINGEGSLLVTLLVICAIRSVGAGIQMPAVNAVIPLMVPEESLMKFNGINATMQSIVQFAAPAAAGAILTFASLRGAMMIDVATAAVGIGLLACILIPNANAVLSGESENLLADMKLGLKYTFADKLLGRLMTVYGLFIFLSVPAGFLATLMVSRVYGDSYWYLTAVEVIGFAGMTIGGLLMGTWGGFKSRIKTLLWGLTMFGVLAIGMGLSKNFILYLALMAIYGVALTIVQTATTTLIMEKANQEMQGRVFGILGTMYSGFLPVGMAVFGPLADIMPLQWIMIASGVLLIVLSLIMIMDRKFRD